MTLERFPHLQNANQWPGLSTVDPFGLQVTFDPYLWGPEVSIHLCRTRLDMTYRNVGGWETAAERDAWFDSVSDQSVRLDTEMHILPGTEIKLPFAFEVLNHYNQIFIDFPPTPTTDGSTESTRFYYFIYDVEYRSPSSTACKIVVDEWSTHLFDIELEYIALERGHAPMAEISADEYLENPQERCELLSTPDENFGGTAERLRYTARDVINAGPHYLVITMTSDPTQDPGEYGHRENWRTPSTNNFRVQGAMSPAVFAIEPGDVTIMLDRMNARAPQLLPTIQAVFLIPKRLVTVDGEFSFMDITCRTVAPIQRVDDLMELSVDKFGYPARYRDIAKLYTAPYAWIEIVDESGRRQVVAIEETTGQLRVSVIASILAPFLGVDAYVTDIGSDGSTQITWDNMTEHTFAAYGDWTRTLHHWNVPTYIVLQNAIRTFDWTQHWQRVQANETNSKAYDLSIDVNNLNYALRGATLDRQAARLSQKQANDRTQLSMSQNADASAVTLGNQRMTDEVNYDVQLSLRLQDMNTQAIALAQSQASANAILSSTEAIISAGQSNAYRDFVHTQGSYQTANAIFDTARSFMQAPSNMMAGLETGGDIGMAAAFGSSMLDTTQSAVNIEATMQTAAYNDNAAEASVAMSQLQLQGARMNYSQINASYTLQMSNNIDASRATIDNAHHKSWIAQQFARDSYTLKANLQQNSLSTQQSYETAISNGDIGLARSQAASTKGMSDRSALQRKQIQDEGLANAYRAARLGSPQAVTQMTGSAANYTRPQVLMSCIKTQDAGAIATAGDMFLRYGYRFGGRQWAVRTLTPMGHFSYWKGEAQIGSSVNEVTKGVISRIFGEGVFVWTDPRDIGITSIYDN